MFIFPPFVGNSLGLQPKQLKNYLENQLGKWSELGVEGHFTDPEPWVTIDDIVNESLSRLVGALPHEVVAMNSLTVNLHLMLIAFYKPTTERHKILIEKKAFPSDLYAVQSQIVFHGFDPSSSLIEISPRNGQSCIQIEDIAEVLNKHNLLNL